MPDRLRLAGEQPGISEDTGAALVAVRLPGSSATPQRGQLAACETDVDLLLNDALARVLVTAGSASRSGVPQLDRRLAGLDQRNDGRLWVSGGSCLSPALPLAI